LPELQEGTLCPVEAGGAGGVRSGTMCSAIADVADLPIASALDNPVDHFLNAWCPGCECVVDAVCPDCGHSVEAAGASTDGAAGSVFDRPEFYRRFVVLIQSARNSKFFLGCYLIATGDAFAGGVSMEEFARTWGVKKQTVSKTCRFICHHLGIPPSRYMREERTAAKFRLTNRRPRKFEVHL
jgi:hypothetical protein